MDPWLAAKPAPHLLLNSWRGGEGGAARGGRDGPGPLREGGRGQRRKWGRGVWEAGVQGGDTQGLEEKSAGSYSKQGPPAGRQT